MESQKNSESRLVTPPDQMKQVISRAWGEGYKQALIEVVATLQATLQKIEAAQKAAAEKPTIYTP